MSLWEDVQPWIDKDTGLMTSANGGRDNLVLMTAYLERELGRRGEIGVCMDLHMAFNEFRSKTTVMPGLYVRLPNDFDDNSVDNLIGACYLSPSTAGLVLERWNRFWSCFDVNHPTKIALNRNFYGRFIGLKAYIIAASGIRPSLFQRLLWCLAVVWSVHTSTGSSDPLLMSLQVEVMMAHCPRAALYWHNHYSLTDLLSQYFGPTHPLVLSRKGLPALR